MYRDGSLDVQVLETGRTKALREGTETRDGGHVLPGGYTRPEYLEGKTYRFTYNNSGLFITINKDENGIPKEVFIERGKSGDEERAAYEGMGRLISIALQSNIDVKSIIKTLRGIQTRNVAWHQTKNGSIPIRSVPDAIAHALSDSSHNEPKIEESKGEKCNSCGEYAVIHSEGCMKCLSCSYSSCG